MVDTDQQIASLSALPKPLRQAIASFTDEVSNEQLRLTNKGFKALSPKLSQVRVFASSLDQLAPLFKNKNDIDSIQIHEPNTFNDKAFTRLANFSSYTLKKITDLDLSECDTLTGSSLSYLSKFANLKSLKLSRVVHPCGPALNFIDQKTLENLQNLRDLEELTLTAQGSSCKIGPYLKKIRKLKSLTLDCRLDPSLKNFDKLSCLKSLTILSGFSVGKEGFITISKMKSLESFHFDGDHSNQDGLSDSDVELLSTLPNLKSLRLLHCKQLTNACLEHIKKLEKLKCLDLGGSAVTLEAMNRFEIETGIPVEFTYDESFHILLPKWDGVITNEF